MTLTPRIDNLDKNYLINGGMDFFQRALVSTLTTSYLYANADRFAQAKIGTWTVAPAVSRSASVPNSLSPYSISHVGTATDATAKSAIVQYIESYVARELSFRPISFGMYVFSDANGPSSVTITFETTGTADNWTSPSIYQTQVSPIIPGGGWQFIKFENVTTPDLKFGLAVRSVYSGWANGSSGTLCTTQWKVNLDDTASNFSRFASDYISELKACERYFNKTLPLDLPVGSVNPTPGLFHRTLDSTGGGGTVFIWSFPSMRAVPTAIPYSPGSGAANFMRDNTLSSDIAAVIKATGINSVTASNSGAATANSEYTLDYTVESEIS